MRFIPTTIATALLASTTLAEVTLRIGYGFVVVPTLPGGDPGVGCPLSASAKSSDGGSYPLEPLDGPQDGCPAADLALYCDRWGCPFDLDLIDAPFQATVQSDNKDDKSITASLRDINGKVQEVNCAWDPVKDFEDDSTTIYTTWECQFDQF